MRKLGWVLGGVFLIDGLMNLIGKKDLMVRLNNVVGKRLPAPWESKIRKATNVNPTALTAMGVNNVIAGAGMVLLTLLTGQKRAKRRPLLSWL